MAMAARRQYDRHFADPAYAIRMARVVYLDDYGIKYRKFKAIFQFILAARHRL